MSIFSFFIGSIFVPFVMINRRARSFDSQNPQASLNGYKEYDKSAFFGYEEIN